MMARVDDASVAELLQGFSRVPSEVPEPMRNPQPMVRM